MLFLQSTKSAGHSLRPFARNLSNAGVRRDHSDRQRAPNSLVSRLMVRGPCPPPRREQGAVHCPPCRPGPPVPAGQPTRCTHSASSTPGAWRRVHTLPPVSAEHTSCPCPPGAQPPAPPATQLTWAHQTVRRTSFRAPPFASPPAQPPPGPPPALPTGHQRFHPKPWVPSKLSLQRRKHAGDNAFSCRGSRRTLKPRRLSSVALKHH